MTDEVVLKVGHRGLLTATLMLTVVIETLDITIANVAIPAMQGSLSATQDQIAWVLTSYVVAIAIVTPLTGALTARFGRRRLFATIITGFTLTSMACGAAGSLFEIVLCRFLQGAFGAAMAPLTQALMLDLYAPRDRARMMGVFGIAVMIGPVLGPMIGSYLTDALSWRAVFYVNVPFGILTVLGVLAYLPQTKRGPQGKFDMFGFTLLALAIGALQLMLDRGETRDWFSSTEITTDLIIAGLCFYLFIVHLLTVRKPFLNPVMFRDRNVAAGLTLILVFGATTLATMALMPPFLARLRGYPTLDVGLAMMPRGIGTTLAMFAASKLINRVDARALVIFGMGCVALSLWGMAGFNLNIGVTQILWTGVAQGFGLGLVFVTLSVATFATLAPALRADATALFALLRSLGGSFGTAVVMSVLANATQASHARLASYVTPYNRGLQNAGASRLWNLASPGGLAAVNHEVATQAGLIAFLNDFRMMACVCLLAMPLALLLRPGGGQTEA